MQSIKDMLPEEIAEFLEEHGEKRFRAEQIFKWIARGVGSYEEMSNLPKKLRKLLETNISFGGLKLIEKKVSAKDGNAKYLFETLDFLHIESVLMKYEYGDTVCISTQAGCRMGCSFCASTIEGLEKNLSPGEMLDQILYINEDIGRTVHNIVLMGSGEPFDNYENMCKFLRLVTDSRGFGLGMRRITVSTCGIVPQILRFANDFPQINLAISLHAATDAKRNKLMAVNRRYPIADLIEACDEYIRITNRRISFEYALMTGENDSESDIDALIELLRGRLCHVNLIPVNKVAEYSYRPTDRRKANKIAQRLKKSGIASTVRRKLADDIDGACGQLRLRRAEK